MPKFRATLITAASLAALSLPLLAAPAFAGGPGKPVTFTVTVENVSGDDTLKLPDGKATRAPIAPGVYAVFQGTSPIFTVGKGASPALERLAEDGDTKALERALEGRLNSGPLIPGFGVQVTAGPGDRLSFATMFVQSNDSFYGPKDGGIDLFDRDGMPISGDLTERVVLYDAGTELNEPPGAGPNQAPRQKHPDTGPSESRDVRPVDNGFEYPAVPAVIKVTVTAGTSGSI
ncbi:spondin domain-containing protein [Azospirillum sp. BE72]|uniref:spondin domain-containing protein n=1 Tax=Azospirillum sp. BE72 TaxID=2817776 RepID=UPI0028606397|nr:spondin domain-containing protein [Azospirillum sp. BE72]MDR6775603.1 hypothetical protein [Azospirillum sp. BE72]